MPAPLTSLIGRQTELAEAVRCLLDPDVRLLTLTGAPVSCKTRLAVAVAEAVQTDFRHGVWFVPLAALQHSDLVLPTIAHILQPLGGARGVIASVDRVLWAEDEAPPGPTDHAERRVPRARGDLLVEDMQELEGVQDRPRRARALEATRVIHHGVPRQKCGDLPACQILLASASNRSA
ncbi:MAG: hypothetical protein JOZ87_30265, partial [Chloroflexi bacterium]|nr:hypothetical protein [Chloroflexota bacterium]